MDHFDVIIVGAGLSGIGAARLLQDRCPNKTFAILEGRETLGGTWDLFRYPGIRSDSDMYTMGYDSKPWGDAKAIADGDAILAYLQEAAAERGLERHIRFNHRVTAAAWNSDKARWTVEVNKRGDAGQRRYTCNFLYMCSGYYHYENGYTPNFEGIDEFTGPLVHPQQWPTALDYADKRVIVIGSGATAMTLVPALAKSAAHVTMLQRSPTYVVSLPAKDAIANFLKKLLPEKLAYRLTRAKNIWFQQYIYRQTRVRPEKVKAKILKLIRKQLGVDYDVDKHFTPSYKPWDERLCLAPDADFFKAIRSGKTTVVTDHIERFTPTGIKLKSGEILEGDIIVTATGLDLLLLGGVKFTVDNAPVNFSNTITYKGMMYSDVPNLASIMGYVNASWTLRSELVAEYVCRLITHMDEIGAERCVPRLRPEDQNMVRHPFVENFSPGYIRRALHHMPKQGDRDPWRNTQNYALDKTVIRKAPIEDGVLVFDAPSSGSHQTPSADLTRRKAPWRSVA